METNNLKEEFFFKGNEIGCLLIHGFSSTPAEMRELGEKLKTEGYSVLGVKLAGHGTSLEEFETSKYTHWINSVKTAYDKLIASCSKIYIIGHSMGGVLALNIAENYPVDKLVLLAPALVNKNKLTVFLPILKHFIKYTEWPPEERPEEERKYLLGYNKIPLASACELSKLQRATRTNLNKLDKPILIIHSTKDNAIAEKGIDIIEREVSSKEVKRILLNKCAHNITIECEKETVFKEVIKFLK
ncbi:alpha/beta hydrolase [Clostridium hydrogenum]|uniref:alpha/beta hydrolase n=1 Tax=Clostridium hydrogenum TaxID=2855764 RepID=UPI001F41EBF8|nr:alpha/beta fold hydrolase [Clostridium hydrogenum]